MIPIVKREPPTELEHVMAAIRDRTQFTVAHMDASGRWSIYQRKIYFIQCDAKLIAVYDKEAEQWFLDARQQQLSRGWAAQVVLDALGRDTVIDVNYPMLKSIHKYGYVGVVRKRLNVAKEK